MAELPLDTPLVAKHSDFSCISCGDKVDVLFTEAIAKGHVHEDEGTSPENVKMCYPNTIKQEIRDDKERRFRALVYTKQGTLLATDNEKEEVCTFATNGEMLNSFEVQDAASCVEDIASLSDGNIAT